MPVPQNCNEFSIQSQYKPYSLDGLRIIAGINETPPVLSARDIFVTTGTSAAHVSSNLGKEIESKTHDLIRKLWRRLGAFGITRSNPTSGHLLLAVLVHLPYFFSANVD
jgi:hypothetical protein